MSTRNISRG